MVLSTQTCNWMDLNTGLLSARVLITVRGMEGLNGSEGKIWYIYNMAMTRIARTAAKAKKVKTILNNFDRVKM